MLHFFRSAQIPYFVIAFIGAVIMAVYGILEEQYLFIFLAFLWIFAWAVIFNLAATKKYNKIVALMNEECKIREYIEKSNQILTRCHRNKKTKNLLLLNLAAGYLNIGNAEFARQTFGCLLPFRDTARETFEKLVYLNNLTTYHLLQNDSENADLAFQAFQTEMKNPKLQKASKALLEDLYANKFFEINMTKGDFDGAEQHYKLLAEKNQHRLSSVYANYMLGKACLHNGKTEKAKQAFSFAAENGGDSRYTALAREELSHLPQKPENA